MTPEAGKSLDDLFHTTDSGAHWAMAARIATGPGFDLLGGRLVFLSSSSGLLFPDEVRGTGTATLYRTVDGGRNWTPVVLGAVTTSNPAGLVVSAVKFFSDRSGVVQVVQPGAESYVYTTSDGGASWSTARLLPIDYANPFAYAWTDFVDTDVWIAYDNQGLERTANGGEAWSAVTPLFVDLPNIVHYLKFATFTDRSDGWGGAGCRGIVIVHTTDGGTHWSQLSLPYPQPANIGGACI